MRIHKHLLPIIFVLFLSVAAYSQTCPEGSQCVSQGTIDKCAQAFDTVKAQKAVLEVKDAEIATLKAAIESGKAREAVLEKDLAVEQAKRMEIEKSALEVKQLQERENLRLMQQIEFLLKHGRTRNFIKIF